MRHYLFLLRNEIYAGKKIKLKSPKTSKESRKDLASEYLYFSKNEA